MNKVTIHPSISKELKQTILNIKKQHIEIKNVGSFPEFGSFSSLIEFLLIEGIKSYEKNIGEK